MPKLIENVLIGGRIRLAGEDISEADARGIRPEVFSPEDESAADEPAESAPEEKAPAKAPRRRSNRTPGGK